MITLPVDEAYAFDYLAILKVKESPLYEQMASNVAEQVGEILFTKIVTSPEYSSLIDANRRVFEQVERARYGFTTAKQLDNANMDRHVAKQALQKTFFHTELTEIKT